MEKNKQIFEYEFFRHLQPVGRAKSLLQSPQQRFVDAGDTLWVPVQKAKAGSIIVVTEISYQFFSMQAEQDCKVTLDVGEHGVLESGKFDDPQKTKGTFNGRVVTETRNTNPTATTGGLYTRSTASGASTPDNFSQSGKYYALALETQDIYWKVINSSSIYKHPVLLDVRGYSFKKSEVLKCAN